MDKFFATCPRGLELILADELRALQAVKVHAVGGGVEFYGDFFLCMRVNLESRIASRVLWQVLTGRYNSEEDIYRAAFARSPASTLSRLRSKMPCAIKFASVQNNARVSIRTTRIFPFKPI
jgi:23S rRNA G2445 N2-methylase RlmL